MDELLKTVGDELKKLGFVEEPEKTWILKTGIQVGGGTMIVNGQPFQQAGKVVEVEVKVVFIGEGSIDDTVPFAEFSTQVMQEGQVTVLPVECVYLDSSTSFINYIKSILGIKS